MSAEALYHLGIKALVRNSEGSVLLLQVNPAKLRDERKAYWDLPGGRVQKGDSVEDTLKREVAEETGVTKITVGEPITTVLSNISIPVENGESVGLILSVYSCSIPYDAAVILSDEHVAYEWVASAEAAKRLIVKYPADFCKSITEQ
jgi:8-oxo-dGTP diphosphatase